MKVKGSRERDFKEFWEVGTLAGEWSNECAAGGGVASGDLKKRNDTMEKM